ncbi:hypothetical protein SDC9_165938 [bioreactor metagenome]|uniref:Uncharacterized protein n=1 Tax=bioreactor metagenome TaxID=1076179 RepID=A0A645FVN6_9ZZZZ
MGPRCIEPIPNPLVAAHDRKATDQEPSQHHPSKKYPGGGRPRLRLVALGNPDHGHQTEQAKAERQKKGSAIAPSSEIRRHRL